MWRRTINIFPRTAVRPIFLLNRILPGGAANEIDIRSSSGRDVDGLIEKSVPHIRLSKEEERTGLELLGAMGVPAEAKFVIVNFRDHAYIDDLLGPGKDARDGYRNADINSFELAARWLVSKDYYVIRCGAKVENKFNLDNPMIIDYATSRWRSDFMDIYLVANCSFAVSTGTGWDGIATIFRKPVCYVNICPLSYLPTFQEKDLLLTKNHFAKGHESTPLKLREIFSSRAHAALSSQDFDDLGIILKENSSEDLLDVVIEMDGRVSGRDASSDADIVLQNKFRFVYRECIETWGSSHLHGGLRARYSKNFLLKNPLWLE